jgi:glycosyltransferase involved in cell wall biosynthesis
MWAMRRLVAREPLDLVFFPAVYTYYPVGGRVPCVVTIHDVIPEKLPQMVFENRQSRFLWNVKVRAALRRSSRIATVSEASKNGLMKQFGLSADQIRLISEAPSRHFHPVTTASEQHREILERYELCSSEKFFIYVGGLSPHKNIDTLIHAFAQVKKRTPCPMGLLLVGDYKGDVFRTCYADLCELIASLGISDSVSFPGYVPDEHLPHLFVASRAFVFPSFLEGFGLPVVEAMACGAAVIATDRGSLPEVVGDAGHLFDPCDVGSLADAMSRVAVDDAYCRDLRARSLSRVRKFSWEKSAEQAVSIFHEFKI